MRDRAREIATVVAERLGDPDTVRPIAERSAAAVGVPGTWHPLSLATGFPGVALLHLAIPRRHNRHLEMADRHLRATQAHIPAAASPSVLEGFGSMIAVAALANRATGRYLRITDTGLRWLADLTERTAADQNDAWNTGAIAADDRVWDFACGLTGAVRVLLAATEAAGTQFVGAIHSALGALVRLARPVQTQVWGDLPGWWIPPGSPRFTAGGLDTGLAHGISGPLALLALATRAGITVAGQAEAMRVIADWLIAQRLPDHRWPAIVGLDGTAAGRAATRSAWCYGVAGTARALILAGHALGDPAVVDVGVAALQAMATQNETSWQLLGPTVCHGTAGVLLVVQRTAIESADATLSTLTDQLASNLINGFDAAAPFGYRHVHDVGPGGPVLADIPGVLLGAAGIALALWSYAEPHQTTSTAWSQLLLVN
ncbi:MAG: lanthionine synthetase C family protein [Sporichthyaceae bacterium]|nr:lanthionine synthetase C family protein [Sporichthyaceae bacterium]